MAILPWLDEEHVTFPPLAKALSTPNGLLAAGGNLAPETLVDAYNQGIFPWFSEGEPILWWSPDPRLILIPEQVKISRSLRKTLKKKPFRITMDQAFSEVMRHCAAPRGYTNETWITDQMLAAYTELHLLGHAHSVECWHEGQLVGGLYGVSSGQVFFGESMFSLSTDASKVALVHLCNQLSEWSYQLIDCQTESPHLISLGAESISRQRFSNLLDRYINKASHSFPLPANRKWELEWQFKG